MSTNLQSVPKKVIRLWSLPTIAAGLLLSFVYLYFFAFKAEIDLQIDLLSPGRAWLKIYWADQNEHYSEGKVRQVLISGTNKSYHLTIDGLGSIERIRIDPVEFATQLRLKRFKVSQPGFKPVDLNLKSGFAGLEPVNQISELDINAYGFNFATSGSDGQLEYIVDGSDNFHFPFVHIAAVFCILLATLVAVRVLGPLQKDLMFVPVLLLIAVTLALTMAVVSKHYWLHPNGVARIFIHPDEEAHVSAVEYYRHHLLPPAVDSALITDSYSVYGYTRLASYELYYPIVGYLTRLLMPFNQSFMFDARMIGVLFFALVVVFAFRNPPFRPFAAPLLITPQLWYLYSYINSDGFAVLLATIAAYQAASQQSTLNRLLSEQQPKNFWFHAVWLGLLAGGLFLLKLNFYFFILFLGLYLLWRIVQGDFPNQKRFWSRLGVIAVVGMAVYGLRYGLDYAANGPDSKQKVRQMVEQMAQPLYKPSTEINRKHQYLFMRDRGVTLALLLDREKWGGKTFVTAFGAYGFTEFLGSETYFNLVYSLGIMLVAVMLFSILVHGPPSSHWLFAITFACAGSLVAASLWQSWTITFQAQGRYLAPILPMLGVLYYHIRPWLVSSVFNALLIVLFSLGVYSFIFIGLGLVPKIP